MIRALAVWLLFASVAAAGGDAPEYDNSSWKSIIDNDCRVFFDGCNQCVRSDGNDAACTRMACAHYQRPRCRDGNGALGEAVPSKFGKTVNYSCADGGRFSVTYPQSRQDGGQQRALELELRDHRGEEVYRLQRTPSASGEKYIDSSAADVPGLEFFSKGEQALVMQDGVRLYADCIIDR